MVSDHISFSEGEQLEIYSNWHSFDWRGRSLVSGDEGYIPSSCVYSMLESLQLLEFILSVEEVSLPILQKIRNDSSNDEKASLFLETINDDPIMIPALRHDKKQHDKGNIYDYCDNQYNYSGTCNVIMYNVHVILYIIFLSLHMYTVYMCVCLYICIVCVYLFIGLAHACVGDY